jgi:hypothetical protein
VPSMGKETELIPDPSSYSNKSDRNELSENTRNNACFGTDHKKSATFDHLGSATTGVFLAV